MVRWGGCKGLNDGLGLQIYICMHVLRLAMKPMAQAACNDFNKKIYRHGPGVSTGFCGQYHDSSLWQTTATSSVKRSSERYKSVSEIAARTPSAAA
jgi:hypothetical protein